MRNYKIVIGSDHAGYELKETIKKYLEESNYNIKDFGTFDKTPVDYPIIAKGIALKVADLEFDRGIIICGSGIGVSIVANKIKGARAANCNDLYCAKMSRAHNDANILTMGGRVIGSSLAKEIVDLWLNTDFQGDRHQKRIDMFE